MKSLELLLRFSSRQKVRTATFQRRWFVLKANLLFYQERPADRHLLGVIVLEGCAVRCLEAEEPFAFSLVFGPGLKTYTFAAESRQTQESWVEALMSASHCYLSLLVRDLERLYEGTWESSFCFLTFLDFCMQIFFKIHGPQWSAIPNWSHFRLYLLQTIS